FATWDSSMRPSHVTNVSLMSCVQDSLSRPESAALCTIFGRAVRRAVHQPPQRPQTVASGKTPAGLSSPEPVFQSEVLRLEIGQRSPQFRKFTLDAVNLEPLQFGDFSELCEKRSDILQMRERGPRVLISLTAKHGVAIEAETVVKASGFIL